MSPAALVWVVRVAGGVSVALLATGAVPAPIVALAAVTALAVASEAIGRERREALETLAAAVIAGAAVALPALRWQVGDLVELRGIQAVLGPTVTVGPPIVAGSCWAAAGGGALAVGLGAVDGGPAAPVRALTGAVALAATFCGPAVPGWGAADIDPAAAAPWAAGVGVGVVVALGGNLAARRLPRSALIGAAGALVGVAGAVVAWSLPR